MLRRKAMMAMTGSGASQEGYTFVSCLNGTGTQYIDTGVYLTRQSQVYIDYLTVKIGCLFGSRKTAEDSNFSVAGSNQMSADFGNYQKNRYVVPKDFNNRNQFFMNSTEYNYNGETVKAMNQVDDFTTPMPAYLFYESYNRPVETKFTGSVYAFKIWESGVLVLDLKPCVRDADGKPGMLDAVTGKFLTNAGTGEFEWE